MKCSLFVEFFHQLLVQFLIQFVVNASFVTIAAEIFMKINEALKSHLKIPSILVHVTQNILLKIASDKSSVSTY
ncbi:hypothetical protein T07_1605 [Trichinella nelsoni]|uniref:Uncharacterized protein n=1 Tax=Trichinella nelsoni TaxID=6336 RepID=A0A0V0SHL5_9BILA|nr:hypothetical protein T07_1605 [Trichinella nelsoni]